MMLQIDSIAEICLRTPHKQNIMSLACTGGQNSLPHSPKASMTVLIQAQSTSTMGSSWVPHPTPDRTVLI